MTNSTVRDSERLRTVHDQLALGRSIRALRLACGLSQGDLGRPYSRAFVSLLEAGQLWPSERAIDTLARRLGVDPTRLLAGRG